ncbi:class III lanthionine synthetase LanKC [Streptomyces eurocidicus]|uniref:class III lanthionine synthetase LanKC n=1 Tax=Streptomyces eurocidicus TaxID=66423 RepID=UPI001FD04AF0|nr:class III lanthionine synthetase LanKC [Streptomyces eurocidicus]
MDKRYEVYCLADRRFYETPDRLSVPAGGAPEAAGGGLFETARRPVPAGWHTSRTGDWLHLTPVDEDGAPRSGQPPQGWKIHVSATAASAEKTAAAVWDHCVPKGIPFKFVPAPHLLHLRNSKYAGRDHSGKFVTVYPKDEEQLRTTLTELHEAVGGLPGPYVLTDLRWHDGPLYVRYGAFARRFCVDARGTLVPAIEDAEGRLVPDRRDPAFHVPDWVTLPDFLAPHLAARNATTVGDLPYRIEKALHFSNGGGVYAGTDTRDGRKVVLKEARPHAGLAADGADAVARLERERAALEKLSGLGVAPEVRDWFTLGEHSFLVMDFVEGRLLNSYFSERHPLIAATPAPTAVADYTAWALRVHRAVEEAVALVHSRGVVFNDLHMFNIMVAPDEGSVTLIDFEAAAPAAEHGRQIVAHPGFVAPPDRTGTEVDRYALACLRLALFLPVTMLLAIDRGKAAHLAEVIAEEFPEVPEEFLAEAVAEIVREGAPGSVPGPAGRGAHDDAATAAGRGTGGAVSDAGGVAGEGAARGAAGRSGGGPAGGAAAGRGVEGAVSGAGGAAGEGTARGAAGRSGSGPVGDVGAAAGRGAGKGALSGAGRGAAGEWAPSPPAARPPCPARAGARRRRPPVAPARERVPCPATGRAAGTRWCGRSSPPPPPTATTGSSPATSRSSATAADSASRTAPPECCTPSPRPARTATSGASAGSSTTPTRCRPAPRSGSTTASPGSPASSTASATPSAPSTSPRPSSPRSGSGSPPTSTAAWPESGWRCCTSPGPPANGSCTTRPWKPRSCSPTGWPPISRRPPPRAAGPV